MVNITHNPIINLFCLYAPPMGYSFNLFLHHPLIPPWTNKRVATLQIFTLLYLIDFTLLGKLLFCIWVYLIKKINYGSLTGQLNTTEIQLMSSRFKLSSLESYKYKNNAKNTDGPTSNCKVKAVNILTS